MSLIGKPLKRREDWRFLTGSANFVDDVKLPNTAWIAFVRSPHAHARIIGIDASAAHGIPGVLRVLTAADWKSAGLGELTCVHPMPFSDGRPMNEVLRPCFASGVVQHVGDVVAAVVAEDRYAALDAVDAVEIDYEILPAHTSTEHALDSGVPVLHPRFGSNLVNEVVRAKLG